MITREDVLRAAARTLSRNGSASMGEVATAAGISRATLHRHFAGRDALVLALEQLCLAECESAIVAACITEGRASEALVRVIAETERAAPLLSFLITQDQLFFEGMHEGWQGMEDQLRALFARGQEAGEFRIDMSTTWLFDALLSLIASGVWAVQFGRVAANDYRSMVLDLLLDGARARA